MEPTKKPQTQTQHGGTLHHSAPLGHSPLNVLTQQSASWPVSPVQQCSSRTAQDTCRTFGPATLSNWLLQGAQGSEQGRWKVVACVTLSKSLHLHRLRYLHLQTGNDSLFSWSTQEETTPLTRCSQQLINTDPVLGRGTSWYREEKFLDEFIAELALVVLKGNGGRAAGKRTVGTLGGVAAVVW